jgi:glycine cleavage system protein P-like pyridoxal-binding family
MAGAHGEFAGVAMIRAYHRARGDLARNEIIVPEAAHGTNPATATMCGCVVKEIPVNDEGDIDVEALKAAVGPNTAGIMLTNPSTCGVFERRIKEVAKIVHDAGGLLYYDGANLNAILGKVRPGDMGFDVIHMNLHKTFSTPHGGGGPGAGAVGVSARLLPFMPIPVVGRDADNDGAKYRWLTERDLPQSIGRLSAFMGNAGVLLRAYIYMRMLGREGMHRVGEYATLNANYLMARLAKAGFDPGVSHATRKPRVHHHGQEAATRARSFGHGYREASARLRVPRAHYLLPVIGSRMPAHRAHRDREQGGARWFHRRDGLDIERSPNTGGPRQVRTAHDDRASPGRRPCSASARSHLETGSLMTAVLTALSDASRCP